MLASTTDRARRLSRAGGVALAACLLAVAACSDGAGPVVPVESQPPEPLSRTDAADAPSAEVRARLARLRRATAPFHDFEKARAAGMGEEITSCWFHADLGAQGYHFGSTDRISDGSVALLEPELLMYEPRRDGSLRLVGVEYIVAIAGWEGASPPSLLGEEFHRDEALGLFALHVWLWRRNPRGLFADWNPKVSCEHAEASLDRSS